MIDKMIILRYLPQSFIDPNTTGKVVFVPGGHNEEDQTVHRAFYRGA